MAPNGLNVPVGCNPHLIREVGLAKCVEPFAKEGQTGVGEANSVGGIEVAGQDSGSGESTTCGGGGEAVET